MDEFTLFVIAIHNFQLHSLAIFHFFFLFVQLDNFVTVLFLYRFQAKLAEIFEGLHVAYNLVESRLRAEQVKQRVMQCCRAWEDWAIYPHEFLIHLQNLFLGLVKRVRKIHFLPRFNNRLCQCFLIYNFCLSTC